jgi:hypothetical protein
MEGERGRRNRGMLQNAEEKTKEGKTGINEIFTKCQTKGRGRNSKFQGLGCLLPARRTNIITILINDSYPKMMAVD